jgi:UDP-N-acetylmuramoyl-tripeptide--D-alanyl-D-alanine ligase
MIAPLLLSQVAEFTRAKLQSELVGEDVAFVRITTDSRQLQSGDLFVALRGENFDGHNFLQAAANQGAIALVVEKADPSLALPQLVVSNTLLALGQIAAINRAYFRGPLLAITGSSGKTTVKTMTANILRECGAVLMTQGNFNNHIGVPLTLLQIEALHDYAVIEMGASAIGEIAYLCDLAKPDVALINNVMPAHIQGFGSLAGIACAKSEIYQGLGATGTAVVNIDDAFAADWLAQLADKKTITVSLFNQEADCYARSVNQGSEGVSFTLVLQQQMINIELNALGEHSVRNALAAAACAAAVGADLQHIQRGLSAFVPVSGRMSRHLGVNGSLIIDDSYNANPGSVCAAIDVLAAQPGDTVLVLGDMGELGEEAAQLHADIGRYARDVGVRQLFTLGTLSRNTSENFGAGAQHFVTHAELITALAEMAGANTTFLIKGSRSAKTDIIVRGLCEASSDSAGDHH